MTFPKNRITKVVSWLAGLTGGEREREREQEKQPSVQVLPSSTFRKKYFPNEVALAVCQKK